MRSNQIVWVDSPKFIDRLVNVVVAEWRHDMEAANDSVHLVDARGFLRLAHSIDHAAVAARSKHHQALILDHVSGANLVLEIVRDIGARVFVWGHLFRETAKAVENANNFRARLQRLLE